MLNCFTLNWNHGSQFCINSCNLTCFIVNRGQNCASVELCTLKRWCKNDGEREVRFFVSKDMKNSKKVMRI